MVGSFWKAGEEEVTAHISEEPEGLGFTKTAEQELLSVSNFSDQRSTVGLGGRVGAEGSARSIPEKLRPAGTSIPPVEEKYKRSQVT